MAKKVYSSKVEAAFKKENVLSSDGIGKNSIYCTPVFALIAIFGAYMCFTDGDGFWLALAIGSGVFFLISLLISAIMISARKDQNKNADNIKRNLARSIDGDFYKKCVDAGYTDISKRSNVEKIYNIAKAEGYTESKEEIIKLFKNIPAMLAECEKEDNLAEEKRRLLELIEKEKKIEEENKRYINFTGIAKPSAMLDSEIAELKQVIAQKNANIRSVNNGASAYYHLNKQHEANWATHGGIASALGGPAAGVSVAVDVAQRSAAAKEHNQNLSNTASTIAYTLNSRNYDSISDADNKIEELQKQKKTLQMLLVEEISEDKLLQYISPEVTSQETSKSGAVIMRITTKKSPDFLIFDDIPAVVDGSVTVLMMNGSDVVGTAFFSLPFSGSDNHSTVTVVCREVKGDVTGIKFKPHHLWAIEKTRKTKEEEQKEKIEKSRESYTRSTKIKSNADYQNVILRSMKPGELYTIRDIKACCPEVSELSNERISALLRQLVPTRIKRCEKDCTAYFGII